MNQASTKKIPKLRFPEFSEEWEEKRLGDFSEVKRGAASQHLKYVTNKDKGVRLLRINDFLNDSAVYIENTEDIKRFRVREGDLLIAGTGATAGITFIIPKKFDNLAFSYNAPRIRVRDADNIFVYSYLKSDLISRQQKKLFVGNAQHFLDTVVMRKFRISLPTRLEQQKIASFLSSVDEWIENLREQKKTIKKYKKGMMQKIFSQEIRFKDENGNDFTAWEEKKLGEIVSMSTASYFEVDKNCKSGYFLIDMGAISTEGKLLVKKQTKNTKDLLKNGDLIMPNRDIGRGDIIGKVALIDSDEKYVLGSNMYKLTSKDDLPQFLYYLVNSQKVNREMRRRSNGTSQLQIIRRDVENVSLRLPSLNEQEKIAEFLSLVDAQIESKENQFKKAEEWKKGLLQQMFI